MHRSVCSSRDTTQPVGHGGRRPGKLERSHRLRLNTDRRTRSSPKCYTAVTTMSTYLMCLERFKLRSSQHTCTLAPKDDNSGLRPRPSVALRYLTPYFAVGVANLSEGGGRSAGVVIRGICSRVSNGGGGYPTGKQLITMLRVTPTECRKPCHSELSWTSEYRCS